MTLPLSRGRIGGMLAVGAVTVAALATAFPSPAGSDTDPTALVGEGGSFLTPVTDLLLKADSGLAPLNPQYNDANLNNAIGDFIGSAPNSFSNDFVVSERPFSSAETATANANGRTFAYVPFAATPVAVATLAVCDSAGLTGNSTSALCPNIPLTVPLVALLFTSGLTNPSVSPNQNLPANLSDWSDPRLHDAQNQPIPNFGIYQASTLEPSAENTALMTLLDSDTTAKELLDNALNNPGSNSLTKSDTPSETWPFHGLHAFVGGDAGLIGKEMNINAETNSPSQLLTWTGLGAGTGIDDVFPLSSVWAGAPEGTPWNIPTAALENAAGKFVPPSSTAAAAAEANATMDPATNLVMFAANAGDQTAYNNYMMEESYLVVPTSGLPPAKAQKLAQFIRFVVGPVAASDMETLGSAPPTAPMVAADLKVATELDRDATTRSSSSGSGSSSSGSTTSTTTSTTVAAAGATPVAASANTGNSGGAPTLASTGATYVFPSIGIGAALVACGALGRRRLRQLRRREVAQ